MQESLGYAYFTETPIVVADVQRAGPATGQATHVSAGDVMQIRYGSHGDIFPIALCPWSVKECFEVTIDAFILSQKYKLPVFIAPDGAVAGLKETVKLPSPPNMDISPSIPIFGTGKTISITGSTYDEFGNRKVDSPAAHNNLVTRLMNKTLLNSDEITKTESFYLNDAEIVLFAYGICARAALAAVVKLREKGIKAGLLKTVTLWPFPAARVKKLLQKATHIFVPELNKGMMADVLKSHLNIKVHKITQTDGTAIMPSKIIKEIEKQIS
jgi:2-oxoglutarate ferredoxin oxidoreductase subunit alpha